MNQNQNYETKITDDYKNSDFGNSKCECLTRTAEVIIKNEDNIVIDQFTLTTSIIIIIANIITSFSGKFLNDE